MHSISICYIGINKKSHLNLRDSNKVVNYKRIKIINNKNKQDAKKDNPIRIFYLTRILLVILSILLAFKRKITFKNLIFRGY